MTIIIWFRYKYGLWYNVISYFTKLWLSLIYNAFHFTSGKFKNLWMQFLFLIRNRERSIFLSETAKKVWVTRQRLFKSAIKHHKMCWILDDIRNLYLTYFMTFTLYSTTFYNMLYCTVYYQVLGICFWGVRFDVLYITLFYLYYGLLYRNKLLFESIHIKKERKKTFSEIISYFKKNPSFHPCTCVKCPFNLQM